MAYTKVNWQDLVTPVDQAHLNQMDDGIAANDTALTANTTAKVDKDSVVAAASRLVASKLAGADAQPAFRILGDGKMDWGAGGSTAPDLSLWRTQYGQLQSTGDILSERGVGSFIGNAAETWIGAMGPAQESGVLFGLAYDTNLYRGAAAQLKTDGTFIAGLALYAATEVAARLGSASQTAIGDIGTFLGGGFNGTPGMVFGSANDTRLFRIAAGTLRTDGKLRIGLANLSTIPGGDLIIGHPYAGSANSGLALQATTTGNDNPVWFGLKAKSDTSGYYRFMVEYQGVEQFGHLANNVDSAFHLQSGRMYFGGSAGVFGDTNLYRGQADVLSTDDSFTSKLEVYARMGTVYAATIGAVGAGSAAGIGFGSPIDTSLYRLSAQNLKTDGAFYVGGGLVVDAANGANKLFFGSAFDTSLYRLGAGILKTDGSLQVGTHVQLDVSGVGAKVTWGSAADTNLYRSGAAALKTDGSLQVAGGIVYLGVDTSLYRHSADNLRTDDALTIMGTGATAGDTGLWLNVAGIGVLRVSRRGDGLLMAA